MSDPGFQAFTNFLAIRAHFTRDSYHYFRSQGRMKVNKTTYNARGREQYYWNKLAEHNDPVALIASNMVYKNPKVWVTELDETILRKFKGSRDSLTYNMKKDLTLFNDDIKIAIRVKDGQLPPLIKQYLMGKISIESVTCFFHYMPVAKAYLDEKLPHDPIWKANRLKLVKFFPFLALSTEEDEKIKEFIPALVA